jgi:hypothetical protein
MALSGPQAIRAVTSETRCLLPYFDAPVCEIFAGLPAPTEADSLHATLAGAGAHLPRKRGPRTSKGLTRLGRAAFGTVKIASDPFHRA